MHSSCPTSCTETSTPGADLPRRRSGYWWHYLIGVKKEHRIQLVIVGENVASRRIAANCGFTLEGTVRGAFFNDGRNQDVLLDPSLRTDPRPWHGAVVAH